MSKFCKEYPNINFYISHCDSNLVVPEILSERATFGIVGSKTKHPHVEYHKILEDDLCLICPTDLEIPNKDGVVDINTYKIKGLNLNRDFYFLFSKKKIFTPTEKKFLEYFSDQYNLDIIHE